MVKKQAARNVTVLALCAAVLFAQQVLLSAIPNIELVSLLVIVFTLTFRHKALYIIYTFALLEGLVYGFSPWWWIPYLYVWTLLALVTWLWRSCRSSFIWAVISGVFGLIFGALCAIPYLFTGGPALMASWWVSGIPFDLIHGAANFALCLALWKLLTRLFTTF